MVLDSQVQTPRAAGSRCTCHLSGLLKPLFSSGCPPTHQTKASSHTKANSDAAAIAIGAHWSRRTRVITKAADPINRNQTR